MSDNLTPPPPPPAPQPPVYSSPPPPMRRKPVLLYGCGALLALLLLIVAVVAITIWWMQRPIRPTVLTPKEKVVVEKKLERLAGTNAPSLTQPRSPDTVPPSRIGQAEAPELPRAPARPEVEPERLYVPGSKVLRLSEREINGLLNANTELGQTLRFEFGRDAINAYLAVPIPPDFPIGGGRMFKARGRFRVSLGNQGTPYAILEDVTVFGVSLPKAWLAGLKGENLLGDAMLGEGQGSRGIRGIKSLRVQPGELLLELEE